MRKVLLMLAFATVILSSCSKDTSSDSVVVSGLTVKKADLPNKMNWDDAKSAATAAGSGWRLPTKAELKIMYDNRTIIGGFDTSSGEYWSSEESGTSAWIYTFGTPGTATLSKASLERVRLVK